MIMVITWFLFLSLSLVPLSYSAFQFFFPLLVFLQFLALARIFLFLFFSPLIFFLIPYEISGLCSALKRFFKSFHFLFLCNSVLLGQCSQPFTGVAPLLSHVASPGLSLPGEGGHGRKTVFGYPRAKCEFRLHWYVEGTWFLNFYFSL